MCDGPPRYKSKSEKMPERWMDHVRVFQDYVLQVRGAGVRPGGTNVCVVRACLISADAFRRPIVLATLHGSAHVNIGDGARGNTSGGRRPTI